MPIELVAFDIGGVLAIKNRDNLHQNINNNFFGQDFFDLQRGKIKAKNYLAKIKHELGITKLEFTNLITIHANICLLKQLSCPYVFASNINILHYKKFIYEAQPSLFALKNSVLSYKLGYLKPNALFFEWLIKKNTISPINILFIDDKPENIKSAQACGLSVSWCEKPSLLVGLLKKYNLL